MPMRWRSLGMPRPRTLARFWPSIVIAPWLGRSITPSSLSRVLLPAPEWPVTKAISPVGMVKESCESASWPPS